jgi:iron complex outermembrane receptor protein
MVTIDIRPLKRSTTSSEDGTFSFNNLNPGTYELELSLVGHDPSNITVKLEAGKDVHIERKLSVTDKELEAVIITARSNSYKASVTSSSLRLQTPLLELPQNVQVVTSRALGDQQIISMSDGVVRNVSGTVRLEHWGDLYTNVSSRGAQVQAFRNGINIVNSAWGPLTEDMSFVDHIEFVKGPAGFMLANGDPAGLYNVVTKKPTGQTKGSASFTAGSWNLYRATLDLDGKISKDGNLLYRLNLAAQNKGSFRVNEFNDRYSVAPVLSFKVDDKTKLTLEYVWQHAKMSDVGSYYIFSTDGFGTLPYDFSFLPAGLEPTVIDDHSVSLNLQHQLSKSWKITTQTAYYRYSQIGTSMWPSSVNADGKIIRSVGSWDAESNMRFFQAYVNGDVITRGIHHRILAGLDMGNKSYLADWGQSHLLDSVGAEFDVHNPYTGVPVNGYPHFDHSTALEQRAEAVGGIMKQNYTGIYVQDELGFLNNKIRITLAGRYTDLRVVDFGTALSAKRFTPRAGLSVNVTKYTTAYALYDQAFIPQNGKLANGGKVHPVTGNNIEFGIKRDWAGGKWNTSIAAYKIIKNNELTADPNSAPNSGLSVELGQKESRGIEFDLHGKITEGLQLVANYAYTESKVTKVTEGVTSVKVGDVVPGYAKHTANVWLNYRLVKGTLEGLGVSLGATALAGRETYWDPSPDPSQRIPDYLKVDGGLSWEKNHFRVSANVFNIFNKFIYSGSYYSWLNAYYWQTETPRNIRLNVAYNF